MAQFYDINEMKDKLERQLKFIKWDAINDGEYYLNLFNQNDKNYHYEIKLKDNRICKFYKYDYSLMSALDEFIRFFIYLDTYMRDNNIV